MARVLGQFGHVEIQARRAGRFSGPSGENGNCFMSVDADLTQAMRWFNTAHGDLDTARALLGLQRYAPA